MTNSIIFLYPESFLYKHTINFALANIAGENNWIYRGLTYTGGFVTGYRQVLEHQEVDETCKIFFCEQNPDFKEHEEKLIRGKFPNAKLVMMAADSIYYGFPDASPWKVDLWMDTVKAAVAKTTKFPAEHFYWNVSETILKDIQASQIKIEKTRWFVSLCHAASAERTRFMNDLRCHGKEVLWNQNLWDLHKIYEMYATCWFALGHTSPVHDNKARSMKGFRDWIAPELGTILIYDDYPDIRDLEIVPMYRYLDAGSVINLADRLKNDKGYYEQILGLQKKWAWDNSLEKQITRAFKKYGFL
jgi:hypothetical protein